MLNPHTKWRCGKSSKFLVRLIFVGAIGTLSEQCVRKVRPYFLVSIEKVQPPS